MFVVSGVAEIEFLQPMAQQRMRYRQTECLYKCLMRIFKVVTKSNLGSLHSGTFIFLDLMLDLFQHAHGAEGVVTSLEDGNRMLVGCSLINGGIRFGNKTPILDYVM